ncbi:unnamed protein product [Parajaminaea phylloscopi]
MPPHAALLAGVAGRPSLVAQRRTVLSAVQASAPAAVLSGRYRAPGYHRHASTQPITPAAPGSTPSVIPSTPKSKSRSSSSRPLGKIASYSLFLFGSTFLLTYYLDARSAIHRWVAMPFLHTFLDPEEAQKLAIRLLQSGLAPRDYTGDDPSLQTELFGLPVVNPIGLAAGFDKQGEAVDGLFDLGFGLVEIGSVTPQPQPGNPQPRYFRLPAHSAAINRFGFNSDGHDVVLGRLLERVRDYLVLNPDLIPSEYLPDPRSPDADPRVSRRDAVVQAAERLASDPAAVAATLDAQDLPRSLRRGHLLSINLGKNKTSAEDDPSDFVRGVQTFGPLADYLVINVSSPNTPGLRDLQKRDSLQKLLKSVVQARDALPARAKGKVPLVLKVSPDMSEKEMDDVAGVILESKGINGVIISNTTVSRPVGSSEWPLPAESPEWSTLRETGGLSGPPLRPLARKALQQVVGRLRGSGLEVIAAGGISTPEDVLQATVDDGASAVQVYTAFGWQGVGMVSRWKEELRSLVSSKEVKEAGSPTYRVLMQQRLSALKKTQDEQRAKAEESLKRGVRGELDNLRKELGVGKKEGGQNNETSVFWPETKDAAYNDLLRHVRSALGQQEPERPESSSEQSLSPQQPSKLATIQDDTVPPAMVLSSAGSTSAPTEDRATGAERTEKIVGVRGREHSKGAGAGQEASSSRDWREWVGVDGARRV